MDTKRLIADTRLDLGIGGLETVKSMVRNITKPYIM